MGSLCCCCCCKPTDSPKVKTIKKTTTGRKINQRTKITFLTIKEQNELRTKLYDLREVFSPPLNRMNQITEHLYLTGFGGINRENINEYNIKHIFNVTYELPYFEVPGIESIKIPVDDNPSENISLYFHFTSDKINEWTQNNERIVVHCMCGISRSSTIVLEMSLRRAFNYVHKRRPNVRPNNAFFRQLVRFEKQLHSTTNSPTKMVNTNTRKASNIPEFLIRQYPNLAMIEASDSNLNVISNI